ncbi:hypothetical protein [Actinoplanes regularis]|uniref:hypothetical protein n=1 Tax=Actinoplanes regularis TaxID=52697 RepID=UPI0024A4E2AB|nr:hypothetical protein [Actinoplanes regularis]GLW30418.1 hypothetical protein Areg01_33580 [Actinoplanes regularis]
MHIAAIVLFGLLAATGVSGLAHGVDSLAVPMILAGLAGVAVASAARLKRWVRPAQSTAIAAALLLVAAGALLAPAGTERAMVIGTDILIGALLVAFALLAPARATPPPPATRPSGR